MTQSLSDLERRLAESFKAAHDEPRWAGEDWTDPVNRVRHAHRTQSRRIAAVSAVATAGLVAGGIATVAAVTGSQDQVRVIGPAGHGDTGTGLDWLMTRDQFRTYVAAHPSPSPATDRVPSPAPVDDELRSLQADVTAALPAGTRIVRADAADGGNAGEATVMTKLPDGTPVVIERRHLDYPMEDPGYNGASPVPTATIGTSPDEPPLTEVYTDPRTWSTGTAYSIVTGNVMGMGVPSEGGWMGPFVWTATADGWFTSWTAPVPSERLLGWAQAADAHFVAAH